MVDQNGEFIPGDPILEFSRIGDIASCVKPWFWQSGFKNPFGPPEVSEENLHRTFCEAILIKIQFKTIVDIAHDVYTVPITGSDVGLDPVALALSAAEAGLKAVPMGSLAQALDCLRDSAALNEWLPKPLLDSYYALKTEELALTEQLSPADLCEHYARLY